MILFGSGRHGGGDHDDGDHDDGDHHGGEELLPALQTPPSQQPCTSLTRVLNCRSLKEKIFFVGQRSVSQNCRHAVELIITKTCSKKRRDWSPEAMVKPT